MMLGGHKLLVVLEYCIGMGAMVHGVAGFDILRLDATTEYQMVAS